MVGTKNKGCDDTGKSHHKGQPDQKLSAPFFPDGNSCPEERQCRAADYCANDTTAAMDKEKRQTNGD